MINLEKELEVKTNQRVKESSNFENIKEVKLLLAANGQQEQEVLREFGLNDALIEVETNRGELIQLEKFKQEYGTCFNIKDIKKLAIDYNLKFLPLNLYNGGVDPLLARKILDFCTEHDLDYRAEAHSDSFYVLAPYADFKLETNFHKKPEPRPIVTLDPLLFYKCDRNEEIWTYMYKWGSEFTPWRLMSSMKYVSTPLYFLHHFLIMFCLTAFILPFIPTIMTASFAVTAMWMAGIAAVWSIVLLFRRAGAKHSNFKDYFTSDTYRSKHSRLHEVR